MNTVITILIFALLDELVHSGAIHNAINLRLNPIYVKDEADSKSAITGVFEKIPRATFDYDEEFTKGYLPDLEKLGISCTNHMTKVLFPNKPYNTSYSKDITDQYLKIPIIAQPFADYKIIVAIAPWNMRLSGSEAKPAVIYFVFPEDDDEPNNMNIPEIYFVRKGADVKHINRKDKIDPLIIVDNNRTVTGLRSKTVSKFIKFKNKLNQDY